MGHKVRVPFRDRPPAQVSLGPGQDSSSWSSGRGLSGL